MFWTGKAKPRIRPHLFCVPKHRDRWTSTGQEEQLLQGDRIVAGADPVKLLRLALERMRLGRVAEEAMFEDAEVRYFFLGHFGNKTSSYISRSFRYVSMFETMRGMSTKVG